MTNRAEINDVVQEVLKEHMDAMNERFEGMLSRAMETLAASFATKLLPLSSALQPLAPPPPLPANNPDRVPSHISTHTLPLENVILTGVSPGTSSEIPVPQTSPVVGGLSEEAMKAIAQMEQRIREVEGTHNIPQIDLSVFSKVNVPAKFKTPDFEKYDGTSNPVQHVQMYQARMNKYVTNGPLMVQTFQASLKDAAMRWYTDYEIYRMEDWGRAANTFVRHFSFNLDVLTIREDLEQTEMKKGETIKTYATRWRNIASQLKPVPPERELMRLFVSTLPQVIHSRILGTVATSFSHLIAMGEEVEIGLKKGWYGEASSSARRFPVKKEQEPAPQVNLTYVQRPSVQALKAPVHNQRTANSESQGQRGNRRNNRQFTPLPGTLSQVLAVLRKKELLTTEPMRPNYASFAKNDPSTKCDYHRGEPGHSTDDCYILRHRIQDLLESGAFSFQNSGQPNVQNNPPPNHSGNVGVIFDSEVKRTNGFKVQVVDMFDALVRAGYFQAGKVVPLGQLKERISSLIRDGMIVHTSQVDNDLGRVFPNEKSQNEPEPACAEDDVTYLASYFGGLYVNAIPEEPTEVDMSDVVLNTGDSKDDGLHLVSRPPEVARQ